MTPMHSSYRLGRKAGEWLREEGPDGDVAMSTRVRLARNVTGYPFAARLRPKEARALNEELREKILKACRPQRLQYLNLGQVDPVARRVLLERHLISREHSHRDATHGVAIGAEEIASIMINEEDHLRIQILRSGFRPREAWKSAQSLDAKIGKLVSYARSAEFGYLTSCPTNVGTGLRLSAMLHLPALVLEGEIQDLIEDYDRRGVEVRGLYGEGTRAHGDLFQFSNRITLGCSEEELIEEVEEEIDRLIARERAARRRLVERGIQQLASQVREQLQRCASAHAVTSTDAMTALSLLRMGIHLGIFHHLPIARINELFLWTQPGHLQQLVGRSLSRAERDGVRAQLVRRWCARHLPKRGTSR